MKSSKRNDKSSLWSRREFLFDTAAGLGSMAFLHLLSQEEARGASVASALAPKKPHFAAKAKACIFLLMEGGPSHIDTFDPKPKLKEIHLTEFVRERNKFSSQMESGKRYFVASPFNFIKAGKAGIDVCEHFEHLAACVDDVCFYRGGQAESVNHPTALYHLNTGNQFGTDPSLGSWCVYGLGTVNQNLPAYVVLPDIIYPQGGTANWSNGFLPPLYQGTAFRAAGSPILDMTPPPGVTKGAQRRNLDLLAEMNKGHEQKHPLHADLAARLETYELAFRMQMEVPGIVGIDKEPEETKRLYGVDEKETDAFGRRCLLARRLIEKGVRFVQVYSSGWDSHDDIGTAHRNRMRAVDKPIAGLLKDLKRRGLLESTLVIWGGEFGRSPDNGIRMGGMTYGRDHNPKAMTMWFAGGGGAAGRVIGATDEIGQTAVEAVHPIRDIHVTILRLLGLDDDLLRYFHNGRYMQLSQVGGQVIKELTL